MTLKIQRSQNEGRLVVAPSGQLKLEDVIEADNVFHLEANGDRLVLDLKEVTQVDRDVVGLLANWELADGSELNGKTVLITTGVSYRTLDVPGVATLAGAGVYYGAGMTEAIACKGEDVYVVGGANSAGQAAVHFAQHASQVTMLVRGESLTETMSHYLMERINQTRNIRVETNLEVAEAIGTPRLEALVLQHTKTRERRPVPAQSLFILIGAMPHTEWLAPSVLRDEHGFILSGPDLLRDGCLPPGWPLGRPPYLFETSVPGVFVAGDARHGSIKRVASGVGEGTIAQKMIERYLGEV